VLKKFFALWHTKFVVVRGINTAGLRKFEGNLVEKIFRQWLRKIWDTKDNTWWAEGLKQRVLSRWNFAARSVLNNHRIAKEEWYLQLEWNSFRIWRAKLDTWVGQERRAVTFRRMNLCYNATKKWRYETKVMPGKKSLQTEVATRILRDTFEIWLHRSRQESKATAIDRMRILREAWTNWRHKSRSRIIRSHVDNRLIQDTFHNWLVAKRIIYTERRSRQDLLRETIQKWAKRAQESNHHNLNQEDLAHQFAVQKIQTCVMRRWSAYSQFQRQFDVYARDFYASRLLRGVFLNWQGRVQHLQKLRQWSRDTEFYFLTWKTLKHWKASMVASRREKRKVAYAQVRRSSKMNLSSGILLRWRSKAQKILDMQSQAREVARNKSLITGMNIFDRWRARTEELGEMDSICRERVLKTFFEIWKIRSRAFRDLEVEAMISFDERQQAQAIKKWKLLVLQFRGRYIQATEVQDKNAKKSFKKMFKYWHQKAAERRPANTAAVAGVGEVAQLGGTARAETWSDFGDEVAGDWAKGLEEAVSSTPLPGYLSTPSRRTERVVAAAARFSSTTPRAPMSTPFERHLRAQYSGGMSSSLRQAPGRSTLGMGGFPDITDRRTGDALENP
jgi:protein SFI1